MYHGGIQHTHTRGNFRSANAIFVEIVFCFVDTCEKLLFCLPGGRVFGWMCRLPELSARNNLHCVVESDEFKEGNEDVWPHRERRVSHCTIEVIRLKALPAQAIPPLHNKKKENEKHEMGTSEGLPQTESSVSRLFCADRFTPVLTIFLRTAHFFWKWKMLAKEWDETDLCLVNNKRKKSEMK